MKKMLCILLTMLFLLTSFLVLAEEARVYTPGELLQIWEWLSPKMQQANVFPFPFVRLQRGNEGMDVIMLQARLKQLGYYGKAIDPHFGSGTLAAMKMFEQVHGLSADGVADVADQVLLFSTSALQNPYAPVKDRSAPSRTQAPSSTTPPDASGGWEPPFNPDFKLELRDDILLNPDIPKVVIPDINWP